jgi:uncharacterized membrane protein
MNAVDHIEELYFCKREITVDCLIYLAAALFFLLYFAGDTILDFIRFHKLSKNIVGLAKVGFVIFAFWELSNYVWLCSSPHELKIIDALAILGTILAIVAWREAAEQNEAVTSILSSLPCFGSAEMTFSV